jgi:hypothetical protein
MRLIFAYQLTTKQQHNAKHSKRFSRTKQQNRGNYEL